MSSKLKLLFVFFAVILVGCNSPTNTPSPTVSDVGCWMDLYKLENPDGTITGVGLCQDNPFLGIEVLATGIWGDEEVRRILDEMILEQYPGISYQNELTQECTATSSGIQSNMTCGITRIYSYVYTFNFDANAQGEPVVCTIKSDDGSQSQILATGSINDFVITVNDPALAEFDGAIGTIRKSGADGWAFYPNMSDWSCQNLSFIINEN